jgi:hypothetical protein
VATLAVALVAIFVFIPGPSILASVYAGNAQKNVEKGDYDKAIEDWTKAIGLRPDYAEYYEFRARVYYEEKGDINRAIADYTEFARLAPGYISDMFEHTLSEDGKGAVITGYTGWWSMVVIPSVIDGMPVVEIGEEAFKENKEISFVAIPAGVVSIGDSAFNSCENLTGVAFSNGLQVLGASCFANTKLSTVQFPDSVRKLGWDCFSSCSSLTAINLPASLEVVGAGAFADCTELANLAIPNGLYSVQFWEPVDTSKMTGVAKKIEELRNLVNSDVFEDCGKLPSQTRSRLRQLGYRGAF